MDYLPLEIWDRLFKYLNDCDIIAMNGLNQFYRDVFNAPVLYTQRAHNEWSNINHEGHISREQYFKLSQKWFEWKTQNRLIGATNIRFKGIGDYKFLEEFDLKDELFFTPKQEEQWECTYDYTLEKGDYTYLIHTKDELNRCVYCKPLPIKISVILPTNIPIPAYWINKLKKRWFTPCKTFRSYQLAKGVVVKRRDNIPYLRREHQRIMTELIITKHNPLEINRDYNK